MHPIFSLEQEAIPGACKQVASGKTAAVARPVSSHRLADQRRIKQEGVTK
jgi:hypothetical protein